MKWQPKSYLCAKLVDDDGLILGDVDHCVRFNSEWDASLRAPHRHLGTYISQEQAQKAVERAAASLAEGQQK